MWFSAANAKDVLKNTLTISGDYDVNFDFGTYCSDNRSDLESESQRIFFSFHYYFVDNLAIGLGFEKYSESRKYQDFDDKYQLSRILPGLMYNFSVDERISVKFAFAYAMYDDEYRSSELSGVDTRDFSGVIISLALNYHIVEYSSVDLKLEYYDIDIDDDIEAVNYSGFKAGLGLTVYIP